MQFSGSSKRNQSGMLVGRNFSEKWASNRAQQWSTTWTLNRTRVFFILTSVLKTWQSNGNNIWSIDYQTRPTRFWMRQIHYPKDRVQGRIKTAAVVYIRLSKLLSNHETIFYYCCLLYCFLSKTAHIRRYSKYWGFEQFVTSGQHYYWREVTEARMTCSLTPRS